MIHDVQTLVFSLPFIIWVSVSLIFGVIVLKAKNIILCSKIPREEKEIRYIIELSVERINPRLNYHLFKHQDTFRDHNLDLISAVQLYNPRDIIREDEHIL